MVEIIIIVKEMQVVVQELKKASEFIGQAREWLQIRFNKWTVFKKLT